MPRGGGEHGVAAVLDSASNSLLRRRALLSRFSTGHVVMVLAGLLGALLTLGVLHSANGTSPMLAAAHDIPPGTVIDRDVLRVAHVHADAATLATLFASRDLDSLRGHVAVEEIPAGALVTHAAVRSASVGVAPRAMSFPIPRSRAVGGALDAGDRVDVLAVQRTSGRSGYVASDVQVLAFSSHDDGPLQSSDDASVTLAVDSAAAARIASALETGTITLVRATGAAPLRLASPFDPVDGQTVGVRQGER
jgi:Flp pilus assembly protein CpaB